MFIPIRGFESNYEISIDGIVRSKDRTQIDTMGRKRSWKGKILKPDIAPNGYYRITLAVNGKKKQAYLHRLLATHFLENPNNLPQVNHKDGNKLNNDLNNLEWVSVQDNVIHAYKNGLISHISGEQHPNFGKFGSESKKAKKVKSTNIITGEVKIYGALIEVVQDGFTKSEISRCCNHGGTHKGHKFEFV